ncbi:MAG: hypothetical protein ABIO70_09855 [Pseudomonadota bacterium]
MLGDLLVNSKPPRVAWCELRALALLRPVDRGFKVVPALAIRPGLEHPWDVGALCQADRDQDEGRRIARGASAYLRPSDREEKDLEPAVRDLLRFFSEEAAGVRRLRGEAAGRAEPPSRCANDPFWDVGVEAWHEFSIQTVKELRGAEAKARENGTQSVNPVVRLLRIWIRSTPWALLVSEVALAASEWGGLAKLGLDPTQASAAVCYRLRWARAAGGGHGRRAAYQPPVFNEEESLLHCLASLEDIKLIKDGSRLFRAIVQGSRGKPRGGDDWHDFKNLTRLKKKKLVERIGRRGIRTLVIPFLDEGPSLTLTDQEARDHSLLLPILERWVVTPAVSARILIIAGGDPDGIRLATNDPGRPPHPTELASETSPAAGSS